MENVKSRIFRLQQMLSMIDKQFRFFKYDLEKLYTHAENNIELHNKLNWSDMEWSTHEVETIRSNIKSSISILENLKIESFNDARNDLTNK